MNKANLKSYAPQARKDFIAAVTARANQLGLSVKAGSLDVVPAQSQGDVTVIAGQAWPAKVNSQRDRLIERIRKDGFEHTKCRYFKKENLPKQKQNQDLIEIIENILD